MIDVNSVFTVIVPKWENKYRIGVTIAKYYTSKCKLPKEYDEAELKRFGKKLYYIDSKGKKIIKNKGSVGNIQYWTMNGQGFYNNTVPWRIRSRVVRYYHKYFTDFINEQLTEPIPIFLEYKLHMHIDIYEVYSSLTPDISNMWILPKMFEDAVVKAGILRDDSPEFRSLTSYGYKFVDKEEDRKLVITFKYEKRNN